MKTRRWDLVHKFEDDYRRRCLSRLTVEEGLSIMDDLYKFGIMSNKGLISRKVTKERMRFLIKERARFKKMTI